MAHLKKNMRTILILLIMSIVTYLLKYGLNVFLAKHLTAALYGDFNIAIIVLNILISLALFGTNLSALRFLAKYFNLNKKKKAQNYIAWNIRTIAITFTLCFILALLMFSTIIILHTFKITLFTQHHLAIHMMWIAPFAAIGVLMANFLLCARRVFLSSFLLQMARYIFLLTLFFLAVFLLDDTLGSTSVLVIIITAFLLLAILTTSLVLLEMPAEIAGALKLVLTKFEDSKTWHLTSRRLISNTLMFNLITVMDLIIVEMFAPTENSVGYYAAMLTINSALWLIPNNLYNLVKVRISHWLSSESGLIKLQNQLDHTNLLMLSLLTFATFVIIVFSGTLLSHFGAAYTTARIPLIILTFGYCLGMISKPSALLLAYGGHENFLLRISAYELSAIIVLVIPLTHYFDILGTAIGTTIVLFFRAITLITYVKIKLNIRPMLFV